MRPVQVAPPSLLRAMYTPSGVVSSFDSMNSWFGSLGLTAISTSHSLLTCAVVSTGGENWSRPGPSPPAPIVVPPEPCRLAVISTTGPGTAGARPDGEGGAGGEPGGE